MQTQPLTLRDIHLPDVIGWWPPAIGWWLLAVLIPVLCWLSVKLYRRLTRQTAIKIAKKILLQIKTDPLIEDQNKLIELSKLMRRVAISLNGRKKTAALINTEWLAYLDSSMIDKPFTTGIGQCLAQQPYQKKLATGFDIDELIQLCERWLNSQKRVKK